jgi:dipeptidyl aminopeptidase/acylaminoacyl peptidase
VHGLLAMKGWLAGRALWVTLAALGALGAAAPSVWATFPGLNGPLAYEAGGFATPDVFSIQPLAEAGALGTPTPLTSTGADRDAAWSADGRRIAFMSERDGNAEIYVMNADGSGEMRLTNDPGFDADPTFSPDGQIAFNSTRDGNPEIYRVNGDGTGQTRLTFDPAIDRQADWSPDGNRIAFESNRSGNFDLYAMNPDGGGLAQLTDDPQTDAEASWHPDSARIAYTSGPEGAASVFTLVPGAPGRTQLTRGFGDWHFPAWSPDAKQIAFTTTFDGTHVMPADASTTSQRAAFGIDAAWGPLPPPEPVPELAKTANVTPSGTVFVQVEGSIGREPLVDAHEIPVGSLLNTRNGEAEISTASVGEQSAASILVSKGRARFTQMRGRHSVTELDLARLPCGSQSDAVNRLRTRTPAAGAARMGRAARHRRWHVKGKYANGSSGQTDWVTIDTCTKSIVRVRQGVVEVRDKVKRRTVLVRAGQSYTARAPRR